MFFFGYPASSFWGLLTQACFAFLLRFAHSFDSFAFILLFFSSTRASFTLAGGSRWCFFWGTLPPLFGAFLRRLASLSCFALHTPLTPLLSFFLFFSSTQASFTLAGGSRWCFFWVPCLLFLGPSYAGLLRFLASLCTLLWLLCFHSSFFSPNSLLLGFLMQLEIWPPWCWLVWSVSWALKWSCLPLSPIVSHCLRLSPFMWGVGVGWCGRLLGLWSGLVSRCLRLSPFMWGVGVGWCGRI